MGQSLSLDSIISSLDYNSEEFIEAEEIVGPCAFDKLFLKSVPHILERIFLSLDYYSYNNCLNVNHRWKELLSSDSYEKKWKVVFCQEIFDREKRLHYASNHGHMWEVKGLISHLMVNVNCEMGCQKTTPLHEAARGGHRDVVQVLLDGGADPYKEDMLGRTALSCAALMDKTTVVRVFTRNETDLNKPTKSGSTPLHYAAANGNPDLVNMLLDGGAEPNKADKDGDTPLHLAAWYGHRDLVVLLLDRGAAPNMANNQGRTPLHGAAHDGHNKVVHLLLQRGAEPNVEDEGGNTPLSLVREHIYNKYNRISHSDVINILQPYEV